MGKWKFYLAESNKKEKVDEGPSERGKEIKPPSQDVQESRMVRMIRIFEPHILSDWWNELLHQIFEAPRAPE